MSGFIHDCPVQWRIAALWHGCWAAQQPRLIPPAGISGTGPSAIIGLELCQRRNHNTSGRTTSMKVTTALCGPFDEVVIPKDLEKQTVAWTRQVRWLAQRQLMRAKRMHMELHVAGYCLHNDVSERAFQLERAAPGITGQGLRYMICAHRSLWHRLQRRSGRCCITWTPRLKLNGEQMQNDFCTTAQPAIFVCTATGWFSCVSRVMTLLPRWYYWRELRRGRTGIRPSTVPVRMEPASTTERAHKPVLVLFKVNLDGLGVWHAGWRRSWSELMLQSPSRLCTFCAFTEERITLDEED